jgi:hypothetical protein
MAERDVDRAHPVRPFGMAFRRDMLKKDRVFVKAGAHGDTLILWPCHDPQQMVPGMAISTGAHRRVPIIASVYFIRCRA